MKIVTFVSEKYAQSAGALTYPELQNENSWDDHEILDKYFNF